MCFGDSCFVFRRVSVRRGDLYGVTRKGVMRCGDSYNVIRLGVVACGVIRRGVARVGEDW